MPYTVRFNKEDNYCCVKYEGAVTLVDFKKVFLSYIEHPDFCKNMDLIVDFTMTEKMIDPADMIAFLSFQESFETKRGRNYNILVVCNTEDAFNQVSHVLDYAKAMPYKIGIFMTMDEGLQWLFAQKK